MYMQKKDDQDDNNVEKCVKYITRYTSKPSMTESKIVEYNPKTKQIPGSIIAMRMMNVSMYMNMSTVLFRRS